MAASTTPPVPPAPPTPREYLQAVLLSAAVGIPAALVAALFLGAVHYLEHWLWVDLPEALDESTPPWYLVVGLPVVGAAIVAVARLWLPGDGGHEPIEGLSMAKTPIAYVPGIAVAALATLSFGAVLGPEAPVVALGGATAVFLTSRIRLGEHQLSLLSLAGSFAAISALFGGPLVGGVLIMESALGLGAGAQAIPALLPGFVAAAIGYLVFIGFGDWGGLDAPGLVVPNLPAYDGTYIADLVIAVCVGLVSAFAIVPLKRSATRLQNRGKARLRMPAFLLAGGVAVGLVAVAADLLGADSQDVLFSGQTSIPAVLAETSTSVLVVLLVAKAIAPDYSLGAHVAPLGLAFYTGTSFPARYRNGAFVALHGSWNRSEFAGYKVVFVPFDQGRPSGPAEDFLSGFIQDPQASTVHGRPVGLALLPDGSLLVTDDGANCVWRVRALSRP